MFPFTKGDTAKPRGFLYMMFKNSPPLRGPLLSIKEDRKYRMTNVFK
ncbi:hypothetical protein IJL65_04920 [bacterium]|nr:hypothetical protein [bacterium]